MVNGYVEVRVSSYVHILNNVVDNLPVESSRCSSLNQSVTYGSNVLPGLEAYCGDVFAGNKVE